MTYNGLFQFIFGFASFTGDFILDSLIVTVLAATLHSWVFAIVGKLYAEGVIEGNLSSYADYVKACNYLQLDMTDNKNRYPHDFRHWHDIRIDEYHTAKALRDTEKRKEMYGQFAEVANKYMALQKYNKGLFIALIPKSPADLINEGDTLHHCVGRMNYDQKFIREETLIFFIRNKKTPDVPLATIEYSLSSHKVLQCYAEHDSKPNDKIENYVHKVWLPYANRQIKKLQNTA